MHDDSLNLSALFRMRLAGRLAAPRFVPMPAAEPAEPAPETLVVRYMSPAQAAEQFRKWRAEDA